MEFHPFLETCAVPHRLVWYVLSATGEAPSRRVGHTCIPVKSPGTNGNGRLYVIGGANPSGSFSEVFMLDLDTYEWSKCESNSFTGRYEHTAFVFNEEPTNIYVFGGADAEGNLNDVQLFNTLDNSWLSLKTSGEPPGPRTFHNGVCVGNSFIVYSGGEKGSEPVSDRKVHVLDVPKRRWSVLEVRGDAPKSRHGHVMAAVEQRVFIHGGMAGSGFFDDLHLLDLNKKSWFSVKVKSMKPPARAAHGSFVNGSDVYIFGGMNQNGALDDMYRLDTGVMEWTKIELQGPPPASRLDFACCSVNLSFPSASTELLDVSLQRLEQCNEGNAIKLNVTSSHVQGAEAGDSANIVELDLESDIKAVSEQTNEQNSISHVLKEAQEDVVEVLAKPLSECHLEKESPACHGAGPMVGQRVDLALVLGGMDTGGEIFDDCLVLLLSSSKETSL